MQLLERIEKILKHYKISQTKLASILDIPQTTLWRYFSEEHQDKFSQYLWDILKIYPEISKYWLFFGEGSMLEDAPLLTCVPVSIESNERIAFLEQENKALHKDLLDTKNEVIALHRELADSQRLLEQAEAQPKKEAHKPSQATTPDART